MSASAAAPPSTSMDTARTVDTSRTVSVDLPANEKMNEKSEQIYTTPDPNNPFAPAPKDKPYHPDYVPVSAEALTPLPRIPKDQPQPPVHRASLWIRFQLWYNMYRKLFTIVVIANGVLLILRWTSTYKYGLAYPGAQVIGNFMVTVLVRNEVFGRCLYWLAAKTLAKDKSPVWMRYLCTNILQHLGGIHTGTAFSGVAWLMTYVIDVFQHRSRYHPALLGTGMANLLTVWIAMIAAFPWFRNNHHNVFEKWHRFMGWTAIAMTWLFAILWDLWDVETHRYIYTAGRVFFSQTFWFSLVFTFFVALPWFFVRKVPITVELPSPKVAVLRFNRGMQQGLLARISRTAIFEYHAFGTISKGVDAPYHYLICGVQGDFTKGLVNDMPTHIWTRELKVAGVSNTSVLYKRGVRVCTGTGLGAALSSCLQSPNWFLIWIGSDMQKTFGDTIGSLITENLGPERRLLWDSKARKGRPNIMKILEEVYHGWGAEMIFITSNYSGNQEIMEGCKERGMHCFGTLWDF